jgi:cytidine deaminase
MTIVRSMTIKFHNARRQVSAQIRNHQVAAESFFYFSFSLFTYAFVDYWHRYRQKQRAMLMPSKVPQIAIQSDAYYLQKAHQLRLRLSKPPQSEFRVVCCLLLEDGTEMWGTNDEVSPSLSSAICAERAACLSYRSQQCSSNIHKVFVVTDAAQPLPPGTLCREYLYCHPATLPSTKVVMQAAPASSSSSCDRPNSTTAAASASSTTWILTLEDLYPYPSCYIRKGLTSLQSSRLGQALEETMDVLLSHLVIPGLFGDQTRALLNAAHRASLRDDSHDRQLHPIQYGAAMAVLLLDEDRLEYWEAHQLKAYEYGGSQDPVCQLVARAAVRRAKTNNNAGDDHTNSHDATLITTIKVLAVCQVDQYGIPHAPYGAARACLVENGFGDAQVVVTFETLAGAAEADPIAALGASDASTSPVGGKPHWFVDDDDDDDEDDARVKSGFELPSLSVCAVQAKELAPYVPVIRHGGASSNNGISNGISNSVGGGSGFR